MNSKPLKPLSKKASFLNRNNLSGLVFWFKIKFYYPILDFFDFYKERIGRSIAFAKIGWSNLDFDFNYVYDLLDFKFCRIYECLKNGNSEQETEDMLALKKTIKTIRRLKKDRYHLKHYKAHEKKWGELETKLEPYNEHNGETKLYKWVAWRSGTINASEENKKIETEDFLNTFVLEENDRLKDMDLLFGLIKKHYNKWWD